MIKEFFKSKKFWTSVIATIVYGVGHQFPNVDPAVLDHVYWALLAYVGAQGVADVGKSAAQIKASAAFGEKIS